MNPAKTETSTKETGGAAFPGDLSQVHSFPGMTLRDWFAGQALAGMCVDRSYVTPGDIAHAAYESADAMLAERAR